jgi:hypothetical protein
MGTSFAQWIFWRESDASVETLPHDHKSAEASRADRAGSAFRRDEFTA